MLNYTYYHGTTSENSLEIENNKFQHIETFSNEEITNKSRNYRPGSLGVGVYAFAESCKNAEMLARRKNGSVGVISFKITREDYLINFSDPGILMIFDAFINKMIDCYKDLKRKYTNTGYSKKLDGAVIDIFALWLVENEEMDTVEGVLNTSQNKISKFMLQDSLIPNSVELCVKSDNLIDYSTLKKVKVG